ncbi:hypothetical protein OXT66_05690 [Lentilactobacillus senioris]|uniref:hypothetical protein n=1 Tax=Lentilactobacillus senioris TaxID=931534 RepID=UPI002282FD51|nr:hypothetical protein [Lentilactobacillus senioris]MCY9807042.1 hypothetical protein [Lentilactobacillus senioris]
MKPSKSLAKKREREIRADDSSDADTLANLLTSASADIRQYVSYFVDNYNEDGTLAINAMRTAPNTDDLTTWKKFIKKYKQLLSGNSEAQYRIKSAQKMAGFDRETLLSSIIKVITSKVAIDAETFIKQAIQAEAGKEVTFQGNVIKINGIPDGDLDKQINDIVENFINRETQDLTLSSRIWLKADALAAKINQAIHKALVAGIDVDSIDDQLFYETSRLNEDSVKSVSDSTIKYYVHALLLNEKALIVAAIGAFLATHWKLKRADWYTVEDSHVCQACKSPQGANPYAASDIPSKPHIGCRCFVIYY